MHHRIISELQGKTTQLQSLDAQPTLGDIVYRISDVQSNQIIEDNLFQQGAKKQNSTNRRRLAHAKKSVADDDYSYPESYSEFLEEQRKAHSTGVKEGKELFEFYCKEGAKYLKKKNEWDSPHAKCDVPEKNIFSGNVTDEYAIEKLQIFKSDILCEAAATLEKKLKEDDMLSMDRDYEYYGHDYAMPLNENECSDSDEEDDGNSSMQKRWYVTQGQGKYRKEIHIKRAIKILLPREYVSRERSRRHIAANYLPGFQPLQKDHDVQKYRFFLIKLLSGIHIAKLVFLEDKGKPICSCSSESDGVKFRAILYEENESNTFFCRFPVKVTCWLNIKRVISEIYLDKTTDYTYELSENSRKIFREAKTNVQIEQDSNLAKCITKSEQPLEYLEIDDILDRKVDFKTQNFIYLVKFKGNEDKVWIPGQNFLEEVQYQRRKGAKNDQIQFAMKEIDHPELKANLKRPKKITSAENKKPPKLKKSSINKLK